MPTGFQFNHGPMRAAISELRMSGPEVAKEVLARFVVLIVGAAQAVSPIGPTGNLARSHAFQRLTAFRFRIGATVDYAAVVHEVNPTRRGWFLRTLTEQGPGLLRRLMQQGFNGRFS